MAKVDVFNLKREKVGELDLADDVFGAEVKEHLFYEVVKAQLASRRAGTTAAKERSAVSGSHARRSTSRRAPAARVTARSARRIFVGGGQAHPPQPARLELPPAAPGAHRRAQERALAVRQGRPPHRRRQHRARRDQDEGARSARSARCKTQQEDARRRRQGQREPAPLDPQPARTTSSCRPRASTSTTSSATTTSSSRKDAAKALEARCLKQRGDEHA